MFISFQLNDQKEWAHKHRHIKLNVVDIYLVFYNKNWNNIYLVFCNKNWNKQKFKKISVERTEKERRKGKKRETES